MHQRHIHIRVGKRERELLVSMFLEHLVHVLPSIFIKRTERAVFFDERNDISRHYVHVGRNRRTGRVTRFFEVVSELVVVQLQHVPEARVAQRVERAEHRHV